MKLSHITIRDVAAEMQISYDWLLRLLQRSKIPDDAFEKIMKAIDDLVIQRKSELAEAEKKRQELT